MKLLITGMNGTIAPVVGTYLASKGHIIIPLDRDLVDISDFKKLNTFIESAKPDWILHIATGPISYATDLLEIAKQNNIQYLYTSTVSIFDELSQTGPYDTGFLAKPKTEYGIYKLESEQALLKIKKDIRIIRLGWQIGQYPSGNQMVAYLKSQMLEKGVIEAPTTIKTACSFIIDSAKAIEEVMTLPPGIYHCDANDGYSHYEVFEFLKQRHPWIKLKKIQTPEINNTMVDDRINIKKLSAYMKA